MPTPKKFNSARCGLVNIRNENQECFKWCVKCHQSDKSSHASRLSNWLQVEDKYNYEGIAYPATYDDIYSFEEINKVCISIYTLSKKQSVIFEKKGRYEYVTNDMI